MTTGHSITLEDVACAFGGKSAVSDVNLSILPGEFMAFMGPSGCGKTTTLRMIAGLVQPDRGRVLIDGKDVTYAKPWARETPMVWQNSMLFPFLDVQENVAFGLRRRKVAGAEVEQRVLAALDLVGIGDLARRDVSALSGGEKQRVGIARALVLNPRILLLDEPLSALDAHLRLRLQSELKTLHRRLGVTFVYVTHYQNEAFSMADRVVVMHKGRMAQIGTPAQVYSRPANRFVAEFVGMNNIFAGMVVGQDPAGVRVRTPHGQFLVVREGPVEKPDVEFIVPADRMDIHAPGMGGENRLAGHVRGVEFAGSFATVLVQVDGYGEIRVQKAESLLSPSRWAAGSAVELSFAAADAYILAN